MALNSLSSNLIINEIIRNLHPWTQGLTSLIEGLSYTMITQDAFRLNQMFT